MNFRTRSGIANLLLLLVGLFLGCPGQAAYAITPGDGLTGNYYNYTAPYPPSPTANFPKGTLAISRTDATVDFNWGNGSPDPSVNTDYFDVQWTGYVYIATAGTYTFWTDSDDGTQLSIDGSAIVSSWVPQSATWHSGSVTLSSGFHTIEMDYFEQAGQAVARLHWADGPDASGCLTSDNSYQNTACAIPQNNLYTSLPPVTLLTASTACIEPNQITATFSSALTSASATNTANYSLSPSTPAGISVTGVSLSSDGLTVTLTLSEALTSGTTYTLTVNNVQDTNGNTIAANSTASFIPGSLQSGLLGTYYDQNQTSGTYLSGTSYQEVDNQINYDWGTGGPSILNGQTDYFSVEWTGYINVTEAGSYTFYTTTDDGARLYIDGNQVIAVNGSPGCTTSDCAWVDQSATTWQSNAITLSAGYHSVTMQYYENAGYASAVLDWSCTGCSTPISQQVIPTTNLYHCQPGTQSLGGFVVSVQSNATTCGVVPVSIQAVDTTGQPYAYTGQIYAYTSSYDGTWSILNGSGSLLNSANYAQYQYISADNGAVTLGLDESGNNPGTVTITVETTDLSIASTSGNVVFQRGGFAITDNDSLSPLNVPIAGRSHNFLVVRYTSTCGVQNNNGTKNVAMWLTRSGNDPGGNAPSFTDSNGSYGPLGNSDPGGGPYRMAFGRCSSISGAPNSNTNGCATFTLSTSDVGQYVLNLRQQGGGNPSGYSAQLTVRPYAFQFSNIMAGSTTNPGATTPAGSRFTQAGASFQATVTAVAWQTGDPSDGSVSGVVTGHTATPGFQGTTRVTIASSGPNYPSSASSPPGGPGILTAPTVLSGNFSNGAYTWTGLTYSEVGSITMDADSTSYLNVSGADVTGMSPVTGRFYPDHFVIADTLGTNSPSCSASFAYSGQPFLTTTVTAYNAAGSVTQNYYSGSGGFAQTATVGDATNGTSNFTNNTFSNFTAGTETLPSQVTYTFPTKETAPVTLTLRATDTDGVSSATSGSEPTVAIRSGRVRIEQANGPEFVNLPVAVYLESYQSIGSGADGWVTTTDDACTVLASADFSLGTFTGSLNAGNTVISGLTTVSPGVYSLTVGQPGVTGSAIMTGNVSSWLYDDWTTQNVLTRPSALISFGIFTGNRHQIYIH